MQIAKCRSCRASIIWARMKSDKMNPVDLDPVPNGNILLTETAFGDVTGEVLDKIALAQKHDEGELLFLSHFATCPSRAQHRKRMTP